MCVSAVKLPILIYYSCETVTRKAITRATPWRRPRLMPAPIRLHPIGSHAWWRMNAVSLHDTWNLALLGALNLAHIGWWAGLSISPYFVERLYTADMAYFLCDFVWLLALPECVAPRVWHTLVAHHSSIIGCGFFAFGKPVRRSARTQHSDAVLQHAELCSRPDAWCRRPMDMP